ncbi:phage capsid protein [Aureimonas sp. AU12]|uniref:phage capsid protein n=1 Tax=Aureimonas sp. AU12 TaxID=1638161 RepID=UPI000784DF7A|nr:phage capsid protein [Aureimonas sp. AU12]
MTILAPLWYREKIRDMVRARYQSMGGFLDGTMTRGDGGAGVVKFPIIGRVESYELSGSIQKIQNTNPDLSMVQVTMRDFEASAWMRVQDARRQGPNEQAAVGKMLTAAIRRRRDNLKTEALDAFANSGAGVKTIGDGSKVIDILPFLEGHSQIRGAGAEEDVWALITEAMFDQMMMYKEFANADYVGPDLPFAKSTAVRKKTWRSIHFITMPDEHFTFGTGAYGTGTDGNGFNVNGYIDTFMWATDAMGNEAEWDQETPSITTHADYEGTPMLAKVGLSGASVGILPEGVKRIRVKAQVAPQRIAA